MISFLVTVLRLLKAIVRSAQAEETRAALVLAILLLISGTTFYTSVEGWEWTDALYFCATTMSTVGLGDLSPQTDIGKLFTVVYIFVGVGVFITLFVQFARALIRVHPESSRNYGVDLTNSAGEE